MDILEQKLVPGQHLREEELAKRFGVSRTPIRQVLQQLATEGFVEFLPYRGALVKRLTPEELRDLFQIRMALERLAAELFCVSAGAEVLDRIKENIRLSKQAIAERDVRKYSHLDQDFHNLIVLGCGNRELSVIVQRLNQKTYPFRLRSFLVIPGQMEKSHQEHRAILDSLVAKDAEEAGARAAAHVKRALDQFSHFLELEQVFSLQSKYSHYNK